MSSNPSGSPRSRSDQDQEEAQVSAQKIIQETPNQEEDNEKHDIRPVTANDQDDDRNLQELVGVGQGDETAPPENENENADEQQQPAEEG